MMGLPVACRRSCTDVCRMHLNMACALSASNRPWTLVRSQGSEPGLDPGKESLKRTQMHDHCKQIQRTIGRETLVASCWQLVRQKVCTLSCESPVEKEPLQSQARHSDVESDRCSWTSSALSVLLTQSFLHADHGLEKLKDVPATQALWFHTKSVR